MSKMYLIVVVMFVIILTTNDINTKTITNKINKYTQASDLTLPTTGKKVVAKRKRATIEE